MSRSKAISTDELLRLANEYVLDNPGSKIRIPEFGTYIRNKGYNVQDHTLRRNKEFRQFTEIINNNSDEQIYANLVTYKTLDVDAFLFRNKTVSQLKEALIIRDRYYSEVASAGAKAINERKALEAELAETKEKLNAAENKLLTVQAKADKAEISKLKDAVQSLRKMLESYVYPAVANTLLKEAGLLEAVDSIVSDEVVEAKLVQASSDISKYDVVNDLLGGFDE